MSEELATRKASLDSFGIQDQRAATSLDITKPGVSKLILKCLHNCDARLTEEVGLPIKVTDYFIHDVQIVSKEDGEIITMPRLVLIDSDGMAHECCSQTLLSSLKSIASLYGRPPWPNGLTLTVRMKRKGERNIYFFETE
jgi:hypothetical protein